MPLPRVRLRAGREKSLRRRHPWVFSGSVADIEGVPPSGATVALMASDDSPLASAAWSPSSNIRARVWSFDPEVRIDADFMASRVRAAARMREGMLDAGHTGCRLVHAESDGIPGFIADRYGDVLVVSFLTAGAEGWREALVAALIETTGCGVVYERSDADVRALEGLPPRVGAIAGTLPQPITFVEDGLAYRVDVAGGQKTGFYLDQRDNRRCVREQAHGRDVLNCFCYTGAFGIAALAGGAKSLLSIDSSADALALAQINLEANALDPTRARWRDADVFGELRKLRDAAVQFDLIVLDPPKFAPTAHHAEKAARAYKDINLLALKLLRSDGLLFTFSCSGGISADLFQKIIAGAALDARVDAKIVQRFGASADHPVALNFPEGDYLKGLLVRKS